MLFSGADETPLMPTRAPFGATGRAPPSCGGGHALQHHEAAHVVDEVHQPDLHSRPHDPDGAHDLATHAVLLVAKDVLDANPYLRSSRVRLLLGLAQPRAAPAPRGSGGPEGVR